MTGNSADIYLCIFVFSFYSHFTLHILHISSATNACAGYAPVIPLVPSDSATLITSLLRLFEHHLALTVSALQPPQFGTLSLSLHLSARVRCTSPNTFRRHLETHYCQQAFQST